MAAALPSPTQIVGFWHDAGPKRWFGGGPEFDAEIRQRFEASHFAAARREAEDWGAEANGALALLLLLDQFPRHLFRGTAHAFATDPLARLYAAAACDAGFDRHAEPGLRQFFYLPFEHSEQLEDQQRGMALALASDDAEIVKWARLHHDIVARFGRFPHRNSVLGRSTTPGEQTFLDDGGFSG